MLSRPYSGFTDTPSLPLSPRLIILTPKHDFEEGLRSLHIQQRLARPFGLRTVLVSLVGLQCNSLSTKSHIALITVLDKSCGIVGSSVCFSDSIPGCPLITVCFKLYVSIVSIIIWLFGPLIPLPLSLLTQLQPGDPDLRHCSD